MYKGQNQNDTDTVNDTDENDIDSENDTDIKDTISKGQTTNPKGQSKRQPGDETVSISKSVLDDLVNQLKALAEKDKKRDAEIDMLKSVSDKQKMSRYEDKNRSGKGLIRKARVCMWDNKPVVNWKMIRDEILFSGNTSTIKQDTRIFVRDPEADGGIKSYDMPYLDWVRNTTTKWGEVVGKTENNDGIFWTLQFEDGDQVTVELAYVNAF